MNSAKRIVPLTGQVIRNFTKTGQTSSAAGEIKEVTTPKFLKFKETQKKFRNDDGVPVYLKAGLRDKILFQATVLLVLGTFGISCKDLYHMAMK